MAHADSQPSSSSQQPQRELTRREKMFEAEMTNQQLEQMQEYLGNIAKQISEITSLKSEIDKYKDVAAGDDMLVPIAAGIFVKAKATGDQTFLVNVGAGAVVPKDAAAVQAMLDKQLSELHEYEKNIQAQFDKSLARLTELQKEFNA
jgi:prefoldin alpha subunit